MGKGEYKGGNEYEQWRVLIIWEGEGWVILWVLFNQIISSNSFVTWKMAYMMVNFMYVPSYGQLLLYGKIFRNEFNI